MGIVSVYLASAVHCGECEWVGGEDSFMEVEAGCVCLECGGSDLDWVW